MAVDVTEQPGWVTSGNESERNKRGGGDREERRCRITKQDKAARD